MASTLELLLADARTPTGGYAHSGGLERALAEGLAVVEIPDFMAARLRTVGLVEAAFAARAASTTGVLALLELDLELAARTLAAPLREAARRLGLALLRCGLEWWPENRLLSEYREASALTPRAVTLGAVVHAAGLGAEATARLCLYDDAATVAAAAVKLAAVDGAQASGWLVGVAGLIDALAVEAARAASGASGGAGECQAGAGGAAADALPATALPAAMLPATATPLLDQRALVHALQRRRLFAS